MEFEEKFVFNEIYAKYTREIYGRKNSIGLAILSE